MRKGPVLVSEHLGPKRVWPRVLIMLLSILLVLLLGGRIFFPATINPDQVVRGLRYLGLQDQPGFGCIGFESRAGTIFSGCEEGLMIGSEDGMTLFSLRGERVAAVQGSLPTPVLRSGGTVRLCFSPGSSYLAAMDEDGEILLDDEKRGGPIVDACVSNGGCMAYITSENAYKSVATVLNREQKPVFRFSSRTRYLNACALSPDGELLAVSSLEEKDGGYCSAIRFLRTDETLTDLDVESGSTILCELDNDYVYEIRFLRSNRLMVLCQNGLRFLDTKGNVLSSLSLEDRILTDYAVSEQGWLILALDSGLGESPYLLTLDADGDTIRTLELPDRIRSVSACESYAAVLTEQCVQVFDRKLRVYDHSMNIVGANQAIARSDGSVLLVGSGNTRLYIP